MAFHTTAQVKGYFLFKELKQLLNYYFIEQEYSIFRCKTEEYTSHIIKKKSSLVYTKKFELDPEENRK